MILKDKYTTAEIKTKISKDNKVTPEEKQKETEKTEVSNDAYLQAELLEQLNNMLERLRISNLMRR